MRKLLESLNIIPTRQPSGDAPSQYDIMFKEQHPQEVGITRTTTPNGKPLEHWMSGGWNQYVWNMN